MANIGRFNKLRVLKSAPQGVYLQGGWLGEILLPKREVPETCNPGDEIDVFVYLDSEDRYIATTKKPKAQVGEVASLKVVSVSHFGAFLDWGLPKDLLVPANEQQKTMQADHYYSVFLYTDEASNRIAGSSKLNKFISHDSKGFANAQKVDLLITDKTDIGYSAVINHRSWGLLFFSDVASPLKIGTRCTGFIKRIREDGKIDLSLQAPGYAKVDDLSRKVLNALIKADGFLPLSDKSSPDSIRDAFAVSKNAYKMTIGALYKQQLITIDKDGIRITDKGKTSQ
ncbi:RNA binding S1 [Oleiphilus messinensis]|uniref:RNA binding S1 n=1 Tax=Oleiphilus messinensis TaxID=141451 RepID=A0A1Y0I6M4_9GAMM|nr:S1-like domain-containing RNA-binding protein [Oleiphilus messinensis]ARU55053.1 RNA binding S1 [Oleiphilus messinensis]